MSLRQIANAYGRPITHADIQRILLGNFPVSAEKRLALHVPPVCLKCDQPLPKPARHVPAWLDEAVENLRRLEAAANQPQAEGGRQKAEGRKQIKEKRVYARGGKRVHGAHPFIPF